MVRFTPGAVAPASVMLPISALYIYSKESMKLSVVCSSATSCDIPNTHYPAPQKKALTRSMILAMYSVQ